MNTHITSPIIHNMVREILVESLPTNQLQEGIVSTLADKVKGLLIAKGYMKDEGEEVEKIKTELPEVMENTESSFEALETVVKTRPENASEILGNVLPTLISSLQDYVGLIGDAYRSGLVDKNDYNGIQNNILKLEASPLHKLEPGNFERLGRVNLRILRDFLDSLDRVADKVLASKMG
jgi:hypothetical protein